MIIDDQWIATDKPSSEDNFIWVETTKKVTEENDAREWEKVLNSFGLCRNVKVFPEARSITTAWIISWEQKLFDGKPLSPILTGSYY